MKTFKSVLLKAVVLAAPAAIFVATFAGYHNP